jgi:hypothetical protein
MEDGVSRVVVAEERTIEYGHDHVEVEGSERKQRLQVGRTARSVVLRERKNKISNRFFQTCVTNWERRIVVQRCNCLAMRLVDPQCVHSIEGGRQVGLGRQWLFITMGRKGDAESRYGRDAYLKERSWKRCRS